MPSVASEVSASQQSRFHQSNARSRTDSSERSQNSPFSEMLDSTAAAAEPPPAPRNTRADKSDAARPADESRKTDVLTNRSTSSNTKDASDVSDVDVKDTKNADGDATAKDAKASDDATKPACTDDSTTTAATDSDAEAKLDADLAAALQAMFVDPTQPVIAADAAIIAAPDGAIADTPTPDAATLSSEAPQIDALIALQAAEKTAAPATPAAHGTKPATKGDGADDLKTDAKAKEVKPATKADGADEIRADAKGRKEIKADAKGDAKALTQAKAETTVDAKAPATQSQSDQHGDAKQQDGGRIASDVRHGAAKPADENPEPETRSHHAADTAGAAKADAATNQNAGAAVTAASADGAAAATAASAAAPGAALAQPQTLTPAHTQVQVQLQAQANAAAAIPLSGVAVEIATQATAGKQHFEIRLDPPELGRIDVKLDIDSDGNTTTRLVVERSETLDLLKRDANQLERALQQAGIKTSDNAMEFSLRQQFAQSNEQGASNAAKIVVPDDEAAPFPAQRQSYGRRLGMGGGLDIRV